jgi:hypothetical protein
MLTVESPVAELSTVDSSPPLTTTPVVIVVPVREVPAEALPTGKLPTVGPKCRHCGHDRVNRPRGLCWTCYYTPGVRENYSSGSKYAYRGIGNGNNKRKLPTEPTTAPPGSPAKVAILEARAASGCALWHPDDVTDIAPALPAYVPVVRHKRTRRSESNTIRRLADVVDRSRGKRAAVAG